MKNLSQITETECAGLWDAVMPNAFKPFRGNVYCYLESATAPERIVLRSGVDRLGIYFTGKVWADCDLQPIELDQSKVGQYLSSIGITSP